MGSSRILSFQQKTSSDLSALLRRGFFGILGRLRVGWFQLAPVRDQTFSGLFGTVYVTF